jgi:putative acetyltransferase
LEIRTAEIEDSGNISSLLRETFKELNSKDYPQEHIDAWVKFDSPERVREKIENYDLRNFLAIENDEIVGFMSVSTKKAILSSLYVKPEKAGRGLGSSLLQFAEDLSKQSGKTEMTLNSSLTAVEFYEKKDYKKVQEIDLLVEGVRIPVVQMTKILG